MLYCIVYATCAAVPVPLGGSVLMLCAHASFVVAVALAVGLQVSPVIVQQLAKREAEKPPDEVHELEWLVPRYASFLQYKLALDVLARRGPVRGARRSGTLICVRPDLLSVCMSHSSLCVCLCSSSFAK